MSDSEEEQFGHRLSLPATAIVFGLLRFVSRRDGGAWTTEASRAVWDRAKELVSEDRLDRSAVAELRSLAHGRTRTLRRALKASTFGHFERELRHANAVHRLLEAAVGDRDVADASPQDLARIEAVEWLMALDSDAQWAYLVAQAPELAELLRDVDAGVFGRVRYTPDRRLTGPRHARIGPDGRQQWAVRMTSREPLSEEDSRSLREHADGYLAVHERLRPLVGPESRQTDLAARSHRALELATTHLIRGEPAS